MAELLREYPTPVTGVDNKAYVAQVWGREMKDGRWEAWLVFIPVTRGRPRARTARQARPTAKRRGTGRPA